MRKLSLIFLILVSCNYVLAQSATRWGMRGDSLREQGKYEQAIESYTQAVSLGFNNPKTISDTYNKRARCYRNLKKYKQAINDDSYAIQVNPQNADAFWSRAISYMINHDFQLAINDYTAAMLLLNNNKEIMSGLFMARGYNETKIRQYKKAIEDCDSSILLNPQSKYRGGIYRQRGSANEESGQFKLAIEDYIKSMTFYLNDKKALAALYNNCGVNYYFLTDYEQVINNCTTAISLDSSYYPSYFNRGKGLLKKGDKILANEDFKKVLVLDTSKNSVSYIFSLYFSGKVEEAYKTMYSQILNTTSNNELATSYYNMACLLSLMNKPTESLVYLKKAVEGGYSKKFAKYDGDFDNIKNIKEFKDILTEGIIK
jgi:tetratricopeptide (TPR) repeat protein